MILKHVFQPAIKNMYKDKVSVEMASHLMKGVNILLVSDWEELIIKFHHLADCPGWLKIVLAVLVIPVLSLGSGLRRVKKRGTKVLMILTSCILFNVMF